MYRAPTLARAKREKRRAGLKSGLYTMPACWTFALSWKIGRVASRAESIAAEKYGYGQTGKLLGPR